MNVATGEECAAHKGTIREDCGGRSGGVTINTDVMGDQALGVIREPDHAFHTPGFSLLAARDRPITQQSAALGYRTRRE